MILDSWSRGGASHHRFNSLFIGIGSAMKADAKLEVARLELGFNSLFIGIGSAIILKRLLTLAISRVSIPFSSG